MSTSDFFSSAQNTHWSAHVLYCTAFITLRLSLPENSQPVGNIGVEAGKASLQCCIAVAAGTRRGKHATLSPFSCFLHGRSGSSAQRRRRRHRDHRPTRVLRPSVPLVVACSFRAGFIEQLDSVPADSVEELCGSGGSMADVLTSHGPEISNSTTFVLYRCLDQCNWGRRGEMPSRRDVHSVPWFAVLIRTSARAGMICKDDDHHFTVQGPGKLRNFWLQFKDLFTLEQHKTQFHLFKTRRIWVDV